MQLNPLYEKIKLKNPSFEIFFCSFDRSEESFNEFYGTMPWAAFPYGNQHLSLLAQTYNISGMLIIFFIRSERDCLSRDSNIHPTRWRKPSYFSLWTKYSTRWSNGQGLSMEAKAAVWTHRTHSSSPFRISHAHSFYWFVCFVKKNLNVAYFSQPYFCTIISLPYKRSFSFPYSDNHFLIRPQKLTHNILILSINTYVGTTLKNIFAV